ncbi:hypothetical protein QAD02_002491 [Eretmocerus hayati]|uniref:Uncharacterized protein n=1 Tax=Eretmocerus hayati TaxID=131215 RepID=A0ACC2NLY3_9HYME|nr:hypothetical protein QAD02_002491 [Eretmocerus hayati]
MSRVLRHESRGVNEMAMAAYAKMTLEPKKADRDFPTPGLMPDGSEGCGFEHETAGETNFFECYKVKGITSNSGNSLKIDLSSIEKLLDPGEINDGRGASENRTDHNSDQNDDDDDGYACNGGQNTDRINVNFRAIRRTDLHEVVTRNKSKTCSVVSKKQRYISNSKSVPFGYSIRYE